MARIMDVPGFTSLAGHKYLTDSHYRCSNLKSVTISACVQAPQAREGPIAEVTRDRHARIWLRSVLLKLTALALFLGALLMRIAWVRCTMKVLVGATLDRRAFPSQPDVGTCMTCGCR